MIITEIEFKDLHLKVRISEFEELVYDKKILPMYINPTLLKEVLARKSNKYRVETLNPNNNVNFKVITFNQIIEELTNRINKVAKFLDFYYYSEPSQTFVRENLKYVNTEKNEIIKLKKEIKNASDRLKILKLKSDRAPANKNKQYSYKSRLVAGAGGKKIDKGKKNINLQPSAALRDPNLTFGEVGTRSARAKDINLMNQINKKIITKCKGALSKLEDKG